METIEYGDRDKSKTTKMNNFAVNGKILKDPKEIADKLNQYFCTTARRVQEETFTGDDDIPSFDSYLTKVSEIERSFKRIRSKDIVDAIAKLKNSRSRNIPTRFFKDSSKCIVPSLAVLFNKSITEGIFPDNLKISRISAIYKGRGTRSNLDHYRPISVLSVIARLFEKLVPITSYLRSLKQICLKCSQVLNQASQLRPVYLTRLINGQLTLTRDATI